MRFLTAVKMGHKSKRLVGLRVTGSEIGRVASGARCGENLMPKAIQKITLSPSRDIPFDKLLLSQSDVRASRPASRLMNSPKTLRGVAFCRA